MRKKEALLPIGIAAAVAALAAALVTGCGQVSAKSDPNADFNENAENLILGLQQYKEFTGAYPVGNNVSITRALMGQNEKKVLILSIRQNDLNDKGEIVDPWNNPFRFYFSGDEVLIRSAGPNRVWEDDNLPASDDLYRSTLTGRTK
ncbi:MAG: hypothetical protein MUE94_02410 [Verrucomicrobia bacterium]|jgi:hypothetical protein|nr:hypothetical protein [Verrucomicrobiota bacterium]